MRSSEIRVSGLGKWWRTSRAVICLAPAFYDVAVYHCQQAAEKPVKAFLVHHGKPYEKTRKIWRGFEIYARPTVW
jgi:HEPN domain-containing protein